MSTMVSSYAYDRLKGTSKDNRLPCPKKNFTVAIEGNIGSGKSTLLQHFNDDPSVKVLTEPVSLWKDVKGHNILDLMYKDARRWSLAFQSYVQLTMLDLHCSQIKDNQVKLMERSIYSARYCFTENLHQCSLIPDVDYAILDDWFDWIVSNLDINIDLIVYLRASPEVCQERIRLRQRSEEASVPLAYLESLHRSHEKWLIHETAFSLPCPVLVIDAECTLDELYKRLEYHRTKIVPRTLR